MGHTFQDSRWMPETEDSTEPYTHTHNMVFPIDTHIPLHLKEALTAFLWHSELPAALLLCFGAVIK